MNIPRNTIFEETGYKPLTTLWEDFCIANRFGKSAIMDTYKRAFEFAENNYKYLTELVMVLNHQIWMLYEENDEIARIYNDLWTKTDQRFIDKYENNKEAIRYFYEVTD